MRDVVAQSCLFQRKKTFNAINVQELIWHVFSEVANDGAGVRKAFCELVPEELWNQRVQRGPARGGSHVARLNLKTSRVSVY